MTQMTPLSWEIFHLAVELAIVNPLVKFEQCSFIHSRNIDRGLKFFKGNMTQACPFQGCGLG